MTPELTQIKNLFLQPNGQKITYVVSDEECEEYFGFNFNIGSLNIKFRKAKTTPKKIGLFVTLWKRNSNKQTEPFHIDDNFDFYIIVAEQEQNFGFFLFPKDVLAKNQILSTNTKEGKRGFRIYPDWTKPENKQAEKTQTWQTKYFIEMTNNIENNIKKYNSILSKKS